MINSKIYSIDRGFIHDVTYSQTSNCCKLNCCNYHYSIATRTIAQWYACKAGLDNTYPQRHKPENSVSWNRKWWRHSVVTVKINEGKALPSPVPVHAPSLPIRLYLWEVGARDVIGLLYPADDTSSSVRTPWDWTTDSPRFRLGRTRTVPVMSCRIISSL